VCAPLPRLSEAALQLGRGRRKFAVPVARDDAIGEPTATFNAMSAALYLRERATESTFNGIMIADLSTPAQKSQLLAGFCQLNVDQNAC
jgi:hypothetical protein